MNESDQHVADSKALDVAYLYGDVQVSIQELAERARKEVEDARSDDRGIDDPD
jgi:hypothetical protein